MTLIPFLMIIVNIRIFKNIFLIHKNLLYYYLVKYDKILLVMIMKKTSKLTIGIILSLASLFMIAIISFGAIVFYCAYQEIKIEEELSEIDYLINNNIDDYRIDTMLKNYVSSGDYLAVEKATKNYLQDILYYARKLEDINDNEELIMVLSMENFDTDMPDFLESQRIIDDMTVEIEDLLENITHLLQEDTIYSYLEDNVFVYFREYYKELVYDDTLYKENIYSVESDLNFILSVFNLYDEFYTFLRDNQNDWVVDGDYIYFANETLEEEYLDLLYRIENIDYYNYSDSFA